VRIHDYCAKYECQDENDGWIAIFDVCWCPDDNYISQIDSENVTIKTLPRCCQKNKLTILEKDYLTCPLEKQAKKYCGNPFVYLNFTYDQDNDKLVRYKHIRHSGTTTGKNEPGYDLCVGPTVNFGTNHNESIQMALFECKLPCEGKTPCLR
jgi:hypothetical protein